MSLHRSGSAPECPWNDAVLAHFLDGDALSARVVEDGWERDAGPVELAEHRGDCDLCALALASARRLDALTASAAPTEVDPELATAWLDAAILEYQRMPDYTALQLDREQATKFERECRELCSNYLKIEDPRTVREIGLELKLEAPVGDLTLRGIIDRLELDADGELVVTDYKTGRAPSPNWERKSLSGVHFYSFLCESVFGRRPAAIRLMYLKSGETITATPSEQSTKFLTTRTSAVWKAVATACERDDFRPRQSNLCGWCAYQRWCPEFGGDPSLAATEAPVTLASRS